ncbi:hypothetical protein KDK88_01180 [bacterium]|nr:hypothetical protein [bacterium]HPF35820.1 hypothetical protein [Candidatus Krumholzibacteria bacterium]HRX51573.1 hypothetical protein [Candidatus Krumholzibacteria bacterium]
MPVYERGYRGWEDSGTRAAPAWWAIARRGILEPLKRRGFLFLLVVAWVPAIVKGGILYFTYKMGEMTKLLGGDWTDITAAGFRSFLEWQTPWVLIILAIIGSGLITKDREENGLALYFARPLGLRDYILGKGLITLFYYFAVTLFPVLALCIFGYLSTQGATGLQMLVATPLRALVYCTLAGTSFSLVLLALSSMGTRTVFVALWWVLLFATEGLAEIMAMFRPELRILDFAGQHTNMGALILGGRSMTGVSPWVSLAVVLGLIAAGLAVLRARVKPVEVVS